MSSQLTLRTPLRSEGGKPRRVAVVGSGPAGALTAIRLAHARVPVDLYSAVSARRAPSAAVRSGVDAALDVLGEGDSPDEHFEDLVVASDFLVDQPLARALASGAAEVVHLLDRMGVPFSRSGEGLIDQRRSSGSRFSRSCFAGGATGQHVMAALDAELLRLESQVFRDDRGLVVPGEAMIKRFEPWDLVRLVLDDSGVCVGLVAQDLRTMTMRATAYDAVILATGNVSALYTAGGNWDLSSTGSGIAVALRAGAIAANLEAVHFHPTAVFGGERPRFASDALRAEGARLWVPKDVKDVRVPRDIPERERDYFVERGGSAAGNLASDDVVARAIHRVCVAEERGVFDPRAAKNQLAVYLDVTHLDAVELDRRVGAALDIHERLGHAHPTVEPMRVFPAPRSTLGGLFVDHAPARGGVDPMSPRNHATSIPGLYAVGSAAHAYHGAGILGESSLTADLFGAGLVSNAVRAYRAAMAKSAVDLPRSVFEQPEKDATAEYAALLARDGSDGPRKLHRELSEWMWGAMGIERDDASLDTAIAAIDDLAARAAKARPEDTAQSCNLSAAFARHVEGMLLVARVATRSARQREESRGVHFKPSQPKRDDAAWLRASLARVVGGEVRFEREFSYASAGASITVSDAIDTSLLAPTGRSREGARGATRSAKASSKLRKEKPSEAPTKDEAD
ncbi:MAG: FAD-binding protein [Polyangiaceae bacterium]